MLINPLLIVVLRGLGIGLILGSLVMLVLLVLGVDDDALLVASRNVTIIWTLLVHLIRHIKIEFK